jgi:serine/threonine-protein kinase
MKLPVIFNDRYQLIKKIGEGGLAEVYQAQDMSLERMVAVKVLRPEYIRDPGFLVNFHREAQNAAKLSDSYIVAVYDFGQDKGRPYIVMEWIPGSDLRTLISQQRALPLNQAVDFTIQICSAVGSAHRAGIVHGDLKPGNILITPGKQAKVTDFGLARALGESAMDEGEVVWGTPAYFAPEQASGARVLPATDVYAIGIILYEMLTGRVPFVGVDDQEVARKQLYEAHIPVDRLNPAIPEPVARIVDAAMAKNPNERFLTADHLREALIMYKQGALSPGRSPAAEPASRRQGSGQAGRRGGYGLSAPPPPPPPASADNFISAAQASRQPRRSRIDLIMLALGVLAIIAIVGLIPLVVLLYRAYTANAGNSLPLPTVGPGQIRMPDLVGLEESEARLALQDLGLELMIGGEEPHPTWPAFTVIHQSIVPGTGVEPGVVVQAVLSQGPPLIEVPAVVGLNFAEAEERLTRLDLVVRKFEAWSVARPGEVIEQDPPASSLVANRTLVTLIVSNGSRTPLEANLAGQIGVEAYEIPRLQFKPGESISLTFFWRALSPVAESYHLFIHLTTLQGGIVSQIDTAPQNGARPTDSWQVDEVIVDPYQLAVPASTAPGDYQIRIGFYNPNSKARLPIADPGRGEQDNLGALILRTIEIVP